LFITPLVLITIGLICILADLEIVKANHKFSDLSEKILLLYPALADWAYFAFVGTSLLIPPPIAYHFIDVFDKTIKEKIPLERYNRYCFKATVLWCNYFFLDALVIVYLALIRYSPKAWFIFSFGISYGIMGLIFIGQFIRLRMVLKEYNVNT